MSTVFSISEHPGFETRLLTLLQGRRVHPWGESVGLSRATAQRFGQGKFPDPEKLIPACRIERLSLSWMLDGIGVPFLVYPAESDRAGARRLRQLLRDEPTQRVVLVHSDVGYCVLLLQDVEVQSTGIPLYRYTSVEVIGGGALGAETARAALIAEGGDTSSKVQSVSIDQREWTALASGHMGNVPLIGWDRARGGLLDDARPLLDQVESLRVGEAKASYGGMAADEAELLDIFRSLEAAERNVILRQLRALRR